jgi:hypothetical protein
MRDAKGFLTKESVKDIREKLASIEASYPGLKLVAVDEPEDAILWGSEYVDRMEASIEK